MCKDYNFGDMFSENEQSDEERLAQSYIMAVITEQPKDLADAKYWDYINHINTIHTLNEKVHDLVSKLKEEQDE